ncbi:hypothetical protein AZE42_08259, partial [Rhizopogon vesiculosus]
MVQVETTKVVLVEYRRCACPPAMFQGIQRRPDGAGPPVETPVNAAQGVSNANLNQSRSPLPTSDPFMDTAPVGHRFDHSALGLYGDEGHAIRVGPQIRCVLPTSSNHRRLPDTIHTQR